jgi:hypothetical protein
MQIQLLNHKSIMQYLPQNVLTISTGNTLLLLLYSKDKYTQKWKKILSIKEIAIK